MLLGWAADGGGGVCLHGDVFLPPPAPESSAPYGRRNPNNWSVLNIKNNLGVFHHPWSGKKRRHGGFTSFFLSSFSFPLYFFVPHQAEDGRMMGGGDVEASGWILEEIMRHRDSELQRSMLPAARRFFSSCCGYYETYCLRVLQKPDGDGIRRKMGTFRNSPYGVQRINSIYEADCGGSGLYGICRLMFHSLAYRLICPIHCWDGWWGKHC